MNERLINKIIKICSFLFGVTIMHLIVGCTGIPFNWTVFYIVYYINIELLDYYMEDT